MDVAAYLARIGADATDPVPTLQHAHLRSVPFENLSIHLDGPLSLDPAALEDKIVGRRRGGFCYELNGLFSLLLAELGHTVELLSARVHGDAGFGPPLDHLALRVGDLLVDVGFGAHSVFPLRLDTEAEQRDPGGTFRIVPADHGERVVLKDGEPAYLLENRPYELRDFEAMCWWQSHAPGLRFTTSVVCSRLTDTGRITLAGREIIETVAGALHRHMLADAAAVLAAYRERFRIDLERVPRVAG